MRFFFKEFVMKKIIVQKSTIENFFLRIKNGVVQKIYWKKWLRNVQHIFSNKEELFELIKKIVQTMFKKNKK